MPGMSNKEEIPNVLYGLSVNGDQVEILDSKVGERVTLEIREVPHLIEHLSKVYDEKCSSGGAKKRGNYTIHVQPLDIRLVSTFATFEREDTFKANHDPLAVGAVRVRLNLTVRKPTEKDVSRFYKVLWTRLGLKLAAKVINLSFKVAVGFLKLFVFLSEVVDLATDKREMVLQNRSTSMFPDKFIKKGEQFHHRGDVG